MKHAYLILAHTEFTLLNCLLRTLDDERNDVYIHIDKKVKNIPSLALRNARLFVLNERVDVRWGDISVVRAEYVLFEAARREGEYAYYHLLSGVDLPLKSQEEIHRFFDAHSGRQFIGYTLTDMTPELIRKVQRWHLFPRHFRETKGICYGMMRLLRAACLRGQEGLHIRRNRNVKFQKGSQWVSITEDLVDYILSKEAWVMRVFSHTFCADEVFIQTLCGMSPYSGSVYCMTDDGKGCLRAIGWENGALRDWTADDYERLVQSDALFARKFNSRDRAFVERMMERVLPVSERSVAMKISVIVPVYNAALTLPNCLETLRKQTYRDFEVVFVDDCSTDGSADLLHRFAEEWAGEVQLMEHAENRGVAAARNTGVDVARGEYITFLDADDTAVPLWLERAIRAAEAEQADVVGWDWLLGLEKKGRNLRQADYASADEALHNMLSGTMRWNLWLFLIRRELWTEHAIRFIEGANMGEDMMVMLKTFLHARKVVQLHESLYHYNAVNSSSISKQYNEVRRREVMTNLDEVEQALRRFGKWEERQFDFSLLKLNIKLPLLISEDKANYAVWSTWMPEVNAMAGKNTAQPLHTRCLQRMASKRWWGGVRLYHFLVQKIMYGLLYR